MKNIIVSLIKMTRHYNFKKYFTKKCINYGIVSFAILLGFYLKWGIDSVALFAFIIWIILCPITSPILARIALIFLLFTPLLLIIKRDSQAEKFAMFAYVFLVLTVVTAVMEQRSKKLIKSFEKKK